MAVSLVKKWLNGTMVLAATLVGLALLPHHPAAADETAWTVPDADKLPDNEWGRTVRYGRELMIRTSALIGPGASDPAHRYAGNNLSCQSCHLEAGTKEFGLPYAGVYGDFPIYRGRSGTVETIEDRINGCMARSMNGRFMPVGSREMVAMVSYIKFLSDGRPVGAPTKGRGSGGFPEPTRAADPGHGAVVYTQYCATCHGAGGAGQRAGATAAEGYAMPPLWGPDSFNDGAGMDRLTAAASFIRNNMPNGTSWTQPALSSDDAWDVAAFVQSQPRPHKPDLELDFPNRLEKPVDTPYGPYADDFDQQQHVLGPFAPIRAAAKERASSAPPVPSH